MCTNFVWPSKNFVQKSKEIKKKTKDSSKKCNKAAGTPVDRWISEPSGWRDKSTNYRAEYNKETLRQTFWKGRNKKKD